MKKYLLIAVALFLSAVGSVQAAKPTAPLRSPNINGSTFKWNPTTVTQYTKWENSDWDPVNRYDYTYNANGEVASELNSNYHAEEHSWINNMMSEYTYDDVMTSWVIKQVNYGWNWDTDTWMDAYVEEDITITRNAQGYVTEAEENEGWGTSKMVIEYGSDNRPSSITLYYNDELDGKYTDMVWYSYDGQFVIFDDAEEIMDFFQTGCKIKSCTYNDDDVEQTLEVTITDEATGSYKYVLTEVEKYEDGPETTVKDVTITFTDNFGSYNEYQQRTAWENDDPNNKETDIYEYTYVYDAYGISTFVKKVRNGEVGYEEESTVTYDPVTGLPTEVLNEYSKLVFEGSVNGINGVETDNANAPVEYYNLQGIRVDEPANGVYIRRQGNTVAKVLVK